MQNAARGLGASVDGTLRRVGAFDEQALVPMPAGLTFVEAATLSCAGVTAWNVLFGGGRPLTAGQWVLSQGTGGVGLFVVQFARLVGARVIATTSSEDKAELLRRLGAEHVINYRETEDWGEEAKRYTGGVGVDLAVDVTGPSGLEQSVKSLRLDGVITAVGSVGPSDGTVPTVFDTWTRLFTARGVWAGSRLHMEDMCRAIEGNLDRVRPVVDSKVFGLDELKEAYEYLGAGKHRGNVCIAIQD
jgi:NADPH:quinone reductase-like Zn-dependent oxidoreductase